MYSVHKHYQKTLGLMRTGKLDSYNYKLQIKILIQSIGEGVILKH